MGRFGRALQHNQKQALRESFDAKRHLNAARMHAAENEAFELLERRWVTELGGRPIPRRFREKMRKDPSFLELVDKILNGQPIALEDRDHMPDTAQLQDGTVTSRMQEELGADPRRFFCLECGEETEVLGDTCEKCKQFHENGRSG